MHRRPLLALALLTALISIACPKPSPSGGADTSTQPPDGVSEPGPGSASGADAGTDAGGTPSSEPTSCRSDADCKGGVCEGQGCGDTELGLCAPAERICTRDSQAYCGCDGQTFRASGSCPGRRYASKGECTGQAGPGGDGSPCRSADDCQSGICEGEGCGEDQPGACKAAARPCTRDYQPYCGCGGQTFRSSGSCPGQRFAHRGECSSKP